MEQSGYDYRVVEGVLRRCALELGAEISTCFIGENDFAARIVRSSTAGGWEYIETDNITLLRAAYRDWREFSDRVLQILTEAIRTQEFQVYPG